MIAGLLRLIRRIKRLLKVQSESRQTVRPTARARTIRVLLLILFSILLVALYPAEDLFDPFDIPRRGEISLEDVLAPFDITVLKSEDELADDSARVRQSVPIVLKADTSVAENARKGLERLATLVDSLTIRGESLPDSILENRVLLVSGEFPLLSRSAIERSLTRDVRFDSLVSHLQRIYRSQIFRVGVLPNDVSLPTEGSRSVVIRRGDQELSFERDQVDHKHEVFGRLLTALNRLAARDSIETGLYYDIGKTFIQPNLDLDTQEYDRRLDKALQSVSPIRRVVQEGDPIVQAGQRVTADQEDVLSEMARVQRQQAADESWVIAALPLLGRMALTLAAFVGLYLFLLLFRPTIYHSNTKLFALFLVFVLQFALIYLAGAIADQAGIASVYIYPVALLPILVTILFDAEIGILCTIILAVLAGVMQRFSFSVALTTVIIGTIGSLLSRRVTKRSHFNRIALVVIVSYIALIAIVETLKLTPSSELGDEMLYGGITGLVTIILAVFFLPIFEALFGFTTDYTLLELSDLNHPLLKRLALEAPGTYHHSIVVGNLCEAAAEAIGANTLLARVGAYYHDIGKMEIPEYFVENQLSLKSRHEELTPAMSSLILAAHVKKGRWLGEEAGLPNEVLNFIEEHHGTMVMSYFYDKALKQGANPEDVDKFRYPGPRPQTRETGISMLADAVEAASRTLDDPKPARIHNLIQRIINDRFQSGQLDECPLTLRDLAGIRRAFGKVVMAAFHHRVAYPSKEEK
jgi:putative nucleotidyltransferase with HDIG domain